MKLIMVKRESVSIMRDFLSTFAQICLRNEINSSGRILLYLLKDLLSSKGEHPKRTFTIVIAPNA